MAEIALEIRGERWTGWQTISVERSLGAAAGRLELTGAALPARGLTGREPVRVLHDGERVWTGHLDEVETSFESGAARFTARGRSLTADLVDSAISPDLGFGEFRENTIREIVGPFAFDLEVQPVYELRNESDTIAKFAPTPGETYFAAIERACRLLGLLATDNARGELVVKDPSRFPRAPVAVREGGNVNSYAVRTSWTERHARVIAQGESVGTEDNWNETLRIVAEAQDRAIRPTRTSVVNLEQGATVEACERRARWEVAVRAARGSSVSVTIPGWRQEERGDLWATGTRVATILPSSGVSETLVVDGVRFALSEGGEVATLSLVRPDAYLVQPAARVEDDPAASLLGWGAA